MAVFTKKIIIHTLIELLNEKPFAKITVKDIVERCGVNRNTFYYHFRDIQDVMEYAVKQEVDRIMETHVRREEPTEKLLSMVETLEMNKKALLHIYRSVDRSAFQGELEKLFAYVISEYIEPIPEVQALPEKSRKVVLLYEKCSMMGSILDWMEKGMNYDLKEFISEMSLVGKGAAKMVMQNVLEQKEMQM